MKPIRFALTGWVICVSFLAQASKDTLLLVSEERMNNQVGIELNIRLSSKNIYGVPCSGISQAVDIDGNIYDAVMIGTQCWMSENLKVTKTPEGYPITRWCYNDDNEMCDYYGGLYAWSVAMNWAASSSSYPSGVQGICPAGWHLPSDLEWTELVEYLMSTYGWTNDSADWSGVGSMLKSCRQKGSPDPACDTDEDPYWWTFPPFYNLDFYDFSALPGGYRTGTTSGSYWSIHGYGHWWTATEEDANFAMAREMNWVGGNVVESGGLKNWGFSIRCIRDDASQVLIPSVITSMIADIMQVKATGGGNVTDQGGAVVSARGLVWSTTQNPSTDNNEGISFDGSGLGEYATQLTGLAPSTTYYARAYATNSFGTVYGDQVSFATLADGIPCPGMPTVTDVDGNVYQTVLIGDKCWTKENLKTTHFSNMEPITYICGSYACGADWLYSMSSAAYTWYFGPSGYIYDYGALYNWRAIDHPSGLCPSGWEVPSVDDFTALENYLSQNYDGIDMFNVGNVLKSCRQENSPLGGDCLTSEHPRWDQHSIHFGTDDFGFSALPGGMRPGHPSYDGIAIDLGRYAYFWSSSQSGPSEANSMEIGYGGGGLWIWDGAPLTDGKSVRCVRSPLASGPGVPEDLEINDESVLDGEDKCYNATNAITVMDFTVESGGMAILIAGQQINLLPHTTVKTGGYLHARITTDATFCVPDKSMLAATIMEDMADGPLSRPEFPATEQAFPTQPESWLNVYPNPTTGILHLETYGLDEEKEMFVEVYGMTGILIFKDSTPVAPSHTIHLSGQAPGLYFLLVRSGQWIESKRVLILQ